MSDQGWMVSVYGWPAYAREKKFESPFLVTNFGISFGDDDVLFVILSLFVSDESYVEL